jgi:hypothetical protein
VNFLDEKKAGENHSCWIFQELTNLYRLLIFCNGTMRRMLSGIVKFGMREFDLRRIMK